MFLFFCKIVQGEPILLCDGSGAPASTTWRGMPESKGECLPSEDALKESPIYPCSSDENRDEHERNSPLERESKSACDVVEVSTQNPRMYCQICPHSQAYAALRWATNRHARLKIARNFFQVRTVFGVWNCNLHRLLFFQDHASESWAVRQVRATDASFTAVQWAPVSDGPVTIFVLRHSERS